MGDKCCGENCADGVRGRQKRNRNAVKADAGQGSGVLWIPFAHAGQVVESGAEASQRACDHHGKDDIPLFVDTGIAGSILVVTARLQLIAEGGFIDDEPDDDRHKNCQEHCNGGGFVVEHIAKTQIRNHGVREVCPKAVGLGLGGVVHDAGAAAIDDGVHRIEPNPVEHDGGDDLVDIEICLEDTGNCAPDCAKQRRRQQANPPGHFQHNGKIQCAEGTYGILTSSANVKKSRFKCEANGKTGHNQRRNLRDFTSHANGPHIKSAL